MKKEQNDQIFQILLEQEDITWQSMLYEAVKSEEMDPWDIDVSLLTQRFLEMLKKLKEMDMRVPGKVLLAAAILLKIKSTRLVDIDLVELDRLIAGTEEMSEQDFYDELQSRTPEQVEKDRHLLIPRIPQMRKRKVSIYDLVDALNQALEVKRRRVERSIPALQIQIPERKQDVSRVIKDLYGRILTYFTINNSKQLTFSQLIPSQSREDKVYTFIPLLHLTNQRKVHLEQKEHFGEIQIYLRKTKKQVEIELGL